MITAKILLDSISPMGSRITTFQLQFHRYILSEFNTHRMFSRNASSSRAIPVKRILEQIRHDPAIPVKWGKNRAGMSANEELSPIEQELCKQAWLRARDNAASTVESLLETVPLHKQTANRLLEPWAWSHVIMTCTDHPIQLTNFFNLRSDGINPQPEMFELSTKMQMAYEQSKPTLIHYGEWHMPMISPSDLLLFGPQTALKVSAARCARVSYLNHDGTASDVTKDTALFDMLKTGGHYSPLEHQAEPATGWWANFKGWRSQRYVLENGDHDRL